MTPDGDRPKNPLSVSQSGGIITIIINDQKKKLGSQTSFPGVETPETDMFFTYTLGEKR